MSDRSTAANPIIRPRSPSNLHTRVTIVLATIALAFSAHLIVGGRWTMVLVAAGAAIGFLTFVPPLSWLVKPVGSYIALWLVFNVVRARAEDTSWADQVWDLVPRLERLLAGGQLPTAFLQERLHDWRDVAWFDYGLVVVYLSFFLAPHVVAILLLWRSRRLFWRYLLAMGLLFAVSMVSFVVIPTSPPWLVTETVPEVDFSQIRRITESVLASLNLPFNLFSQSTRSGVRMSEVRMEPNPMAAMPSIHFAATALIVFPARRAGNAFFVAALVYTGLMGLALVYLGEHYILDLVVGGVLASIGWVVARHWVRPGSPD